MVELKSPGAKICPWRRLAMMEDGFTKEDFELVNRSLPGESFELHIAKPYQDLKDAVEECCILARMMNSPVVMRFNENIVIAHAGDDPAAIVDAILRPASRSLPAFEEGSTVYDSRLEARAEAKFSALPDFFKAWVEDFGSTGSGLNAAKARKLIDIAADASSVAERLKTPDAVQEWIDSGFKSPPLIDLDTPKSELKALAMLAKSSLEF